MRDFYKTFTVGGWFLLICSLIQIFLLPVFIFPLPLLYIPTAILFLIAVIIKRLETAFPSYLNNDKESVIYNLKIVSYILYIVSVIPLILGLYNYFTMTISPSFWSSLANLFGLGLTVFSCGMLLLTGYLMKVFNYGKKNIQVYSIGYNGGDTGEYYNDDSYNDESEYREK